MERIADYIILEKIYETSKSIIYRGKKETSEQTNIIKVLNSCYPTISEIARFKQECEMIKNLDVEGIVKIYDMIECDNKFAIIQEDFDGISLKTYLKNNKIDIGTFLKIGIKVSEVLGDIHKSNIIHKDIKPHNIIINSTNDIFKITDFGIADEITHQNKELYNSDIIEGTLPYMSPEQTGRMNRTIDYRTDIYSLGITFYEMLTGELPFKSSDPMEVVHSHIAKYPNSPCKLNSSIPKVLSDIIMKMLSKNAEERYQNSFGIAYDLKECLKELNETGEINEFEIAGHDISIKFNIPQNIFGREKEVTELLSTFERVSESGDVEVMLVSGNPGIGKSMLVNEIHKPIVAKRGYFISGKYDQFRRDVPYSSIIQAFQGMTNQILSENQEKINKWKEKIQGAVGVNGRVITDVIPNVKHIIGEQPEVPELGPEQSQNRFNLVFKNFVGVFASKENPLVLFLDDLQWADYASLTLIKTILTEQDIKYLFFIGVYRDNEVSNSHQLMITLDDIKKQGININAIQVAPLDIISVNKLIANFLRCQEEESKKIADIIHKKTNGNPFFVNQFLKTLYEEHLIELDPTAGWIWDMTKINALQVTDNVVEMMAQKITKLPDDTQELLKICSCIGNRFDLETLATVLDKSLDETLEILTVAIQEGLISLSGDLYKFYHDRIQEAAYSLIPNDERAKKHYTIGKLTLNNSKEEDLKDKILYIVDQLDAGRSQINSEEEKYELAKLNLMAGMKSKLSAAYESAFNYLKLAIEIVGDNVWKKDYQFALKLYEETAESAYLISDYKEMERLSEIILLNAKRVLDRVRICEINMETLMAQNRPLESVRKGISFLRELGGGGLPDKPTNISILIRIIKIKRMLKGKTSEQLLNLPQMTDERSLAKIRIMSKMGLAVYFAEPKMLVLILFESLILSLKYGNCSMSANGYTGYGFFLCTTGDVEKGHEYGMVGLKLLEKMGTVEDIIRPYYITYALITHWKEHARNALPELIKTSQKALEIGEFEFAAMYLMIICNISFYVGMELSEVAEIGSKNHQIIEKLNQKSLLHLIDNNYQFILILMNPDANPFLLKGDIYDEDIMLPLHIKANDKINTSTVYSKKAMQYYLFGDYKNAVLQCDKFIEIPDAQRGLFCRTVFFFYYSLSLAGLYDIVSDKKEKKEILNKLIKNQKQIKIWAKHAPMNYLHKYYMGEAELARITGKDSLAMEMFDKAIEGARENKYILDEAVAYENAGRFYLNKGRTLIAQSYMTGAYDAYRKWGAMNKVRDLETRYPNLIIKHQNKDQDITGETTTQTKANMSELLDLSTVMNLLQVISSEIELDKLIESYIKIVVENAGAEKGYIIIEKEDDKELYIQAVCEEDSTQVLRDTTVNNSIYSISKSILNYVQKTKQAVVLNNATKEGMFVNDSYIVENNIKSLLCAPIMYKNNMSGMIYLENNLTTHVFTPERLELLSIISRQAAISIDNAHLYKLATTDRMTDLANNTHLINTLEKIIKRYENTEKYLSLLMLDIDFFKNVNDTYGHQAGDLVLKNVANVIKSTCRHNDFCARYGGEEFVIILSDMNPKEAVNIAEFIRKRIEDAEINYNGQKIKVTISIGIAGLSDKDAEDKAGDSIIKAADTALYKSKNEGRNRVTEYTKQ